MSHSEASTAAPHVICLGGDSALPERLDPALAEHGIELRIQGDTSGLTKVQPDGAHWADGSLLLLDTGRLPPDRSITDLIGAAKPIALVVIVHTPGIAMRLQAIRAKAAAIFAAPVDTQALTERLVALCRPRTEPKGRVLLVDHAATQGLVTQRILTAAGFETRTLSDPLRILDTLKEFHPDLVLTDLHMPGASGAEIAAIIRAQGTFGVLPILFLSSEQDPDQQHEALSLGGDAFLSKTIRPDLLIRLVTQRIEAARNLDQRYGNTDHLDSSSGLATRRHFLSCVDQAIGEPLIREPGNGILLISLDGAAKIGEKIGTGGADVAHSRIGQLIRDRLTEADVGVCLGDRAHAIFVRRPDLDGLNAFAETLRTAVADQPTAIAGEQLSITVSIGIGFFHSDAKDALTIISRAEKACAAAMAAGGNRVIAARPPTADIQDRAREQRLAELIDQALNGPGFRLYYQPLVAVQPQGHQFIEVMLRLADRDGELISPTEFLPVAERLGRMIEVDRWVMVHALEVLKQQAVDQPDLQFVVMQTMETVTSPGWVLWLRDQLVSRGLVRRLPVLGLRLQGVLEHLSTAAVPLKTLRKLGLKICLTGAEQTSATFDTLAEIQPPLIKLAPGLVHRLKPDRLSALVQRLRSSNTEVIVSGIDNPALIGAVWASGACYAQGTFIQAPQSDPELRPLRRGAWRLAQRSTPVATQDPPIWPRETPHRRTCPNHTGTPVPRCADSANLCGRRPPDPGGVCRPLWTELSLDPGRARDPGLLLGSTRGRFGG